jgi:ribonuclease P protein component
VETLRTGPQFERVRREGRSWGGGLVVLNAARNGTETTRCGFITGKKIGNAVRRNLARRRLREAVRHMLPQVPPGWDLVWIARPQIADAPFTEVESAVQTLLERARLVTQGKLETAQAQSRIIHVGDAPSSPGNTQGTGPENP